MMETVIEEFSQKIKSVTNQRFQEIIDIRPELLKDRDNVIVWVQDINSDGFLFRKPRETRYIFEYIGKEIARFSVFTRISEMKFTVTASPVSFAE